MKLSSKTSGCRSKVKTCKYRVTETVLVLSVLCFEPLEKAGSVSFHLQRYDYEQCLPLTSYNIHYELFGKGEFLISKCRIKSM